MNNEPPAHQSDIKIIAALGNPGPEYATTRHNAGWICLDALAEKFASVAGEKSAAGKLAGKIWRTEKKFKAQIAEVVVGGRKIILVKPQTFMNLSGEAITPLLGFYKIPPAELLVIHDEVAFDSGKLRLSFGGSSGGHNGIASVIERVGGEGFWRLRLGVGPRNPLLTLTEWVLGGLTAEEQKWLAGEKTLGAVELILEKGAETAQGEIHRI